MSSMPAILVMWHLLTMMEEKQLLYSKFLVHALSWACRTCKTLCLKDTGPWELWWTPGWGGVLLWCLAFLVLVRSQDLSVQNWLNHLWITGRLGVRFGSISRGRWAGRFCGSVGQPQLLFSVTWHSRVMPLTGEHTRCRKAREAYVDGRKREPYGHQCADCQWWQCNGPQAPHVFLQGREHLDFSKPWWLLKSLY